MYCVQPPCCKIDASPQPEWPHVEPHLHHQTRALGRLRIVLCQGVASTWTATQVAPQKGPACNRCHALTKLRKVGVATSGNGGEVDYQRPDAIIWPRSCSLSEAAVQMALVGRSAVVVDDRRRARELYGVLVPTQSLDDVLQSTQKDGRMGG